MTVEGTTRTIASAGNPSATPGPVRTSVRARGLLPSIFSIVPDGAVRRRPSDLVRAATAALVVAVTAIGTGELVAVEEAVYEALTSIPTAFDWVFEAGYRLIAVVVLVLAVATVVSRRWRLGLSMVLAVAATLLVGHALDAVVTARTADALQRAGADVARAGAPEYPPVLLATTAAAVLAAAPYLTRPTRKVVRVLVVLAAVSAIVLVEGLPGGVIGALAVAWGVASLVQFALGTPAGTPSVGEVEQALAALGVEATRVELVTEQVWGEERFVATGPDDARLLVTVLGRDALDAGLFAKVARFLWYKDSGPELILSRSQHVEHRAYLLLLGARAGARLPELVAAGTAGELRHALLVTRDPDGRSLRSVDSEAITDAIVEDAWRNLERLRAARLGHGSLSPDNIRVSDDGRTTFVEVSRMSSSATDAALAIDTATLLAVTAAAIGIERAIAVARRVADHDVLAAALPVLQPVALPRQVRHAVRQRKGDLAQLRTELAAALGEPEPDLAELRRVAPASLAMAAGAALGAYLLLGELANVRDVGGVFRDPNWAWLVTCFVVAQTPQIAQAIGMIGSVAARLPLGPVISVQFANNFTGLVGGTVATTALVVRFFQKQGLAVAVAVSSGVLNTVATMITEAILLAVGLVIYWDDFTLPSTSNDGGGGSATLVGIVILLGAGAIGAALLLPRLRQRVGRLLRPQVEAARENFRELRGQPRKVLQLFGGNVASQVLFALTLQAALLVYGQSLPLMELVVINSLASLFGGLAPVPGGMGVIEAGLIAGFTAAGIPQTEAIAATFTARTFTAYLPPIWGWFSMQWLRRRDYL